MGASTILVTEERRNAKANETYLSKLATGREGHGVLQRLKLTHAATDASERRQLYRIATSEVWRPTVFIIHRPK